MYPPMADTRIISCEKYYLGLAGLQHMKAAHTIYALYSLSLLTVMKTCNKCTNLLL